MDKQIEFVPFVSTVNLPPDAAQDACAINRVRLAHGVRGVRCSYTGAPQGTENLPDLYTWFGIPGAYYSSIEVYENGAINAFVRQYESLELMGFVRIRPVELTPYTLPLGIDSEGQNS